MSRACAGGPSERSTDFLSVDGRAHSTHNERRMRSEWWKARVYDLRRGLTTRPAREDLPFVIVALGIYAAVAFAIGFGTGFFRISVLKASQATMLVLPVSLFVMPSLLEEILFRGLMLPHRSGNLPTRRWAVFFIVSLAAFILWHPLNALTINKAAIPVFTDVRFLLIAGLMAACCSITYFRTGSLWVPILIHWITVVVWVFFLGGRNIVLD